VLSSSRIKQLIESDESLVTFKADTSVKSSEAAKFLNELGAKGIPLIVIDGPGVSEPILADFYTADSLIELIDRARGPVEVAERSE
jgi:thiol:disulfide interchange protein